MKESIEELRERLNSWTTEELENGLIGKRFNEQKAMIAQQILDKRRNESDHDDKEQARILQRQSAAAAKISALAAVAAAFFALMGIFIKG